MGKVMITVRLMPEGVETPLNELITKSKEVIKKYITDEDDKERIDAKRVPVAFGLTAIHLTFLISDSSGGTEDLEKELKSIDGVSGVEVIDLSLI